MQMHITGRHVEVTDDVRSYVEKRVKKIEAIFNRIIDLQVIIELEKIDILLKLFSQRRRRHSTLKAKPMTSFLVWMLLWTK